MAHMTECICQWCKAKFQARTADVKRGWAKFCSKSCKAKEQEKRTGQNRAHLQGKAPFDNEAWHNAALDGMSDSDYGASDGD